MAPVLGDGPVLVTGASGFVGSHLVDYLKLMGASVVAWDRREVNLLDRDAVRAYVRAVAPSSVYQCAGAPHVAYSWANSAHTLESNVLASHYLLDALRRSGFRGRVLMPGSAMVYAPSDMPLREDDPLAPASPYALSKLAQEQLGSRSLIEDGIDVVLTRSFNHTGPRQAPTFVAPSLARQFALIEAGVAAPVVRVGNMKARRDLTDVRDVVRAYVLLMERGRAGTPYNVCSGVARSVEELLHGLGRRVAVRISIEEDPSRLRPNDVPLVVGSADKLHAETSWAPDISFDRMLDDLLDYWRARV